MTNEQTALIASLSALHDEVSSLTSSHQAGANVIALRQAFDRLLMGYQNGTYDASTVESGISEIRAAIRSNAHATPLMPNDSSSLRDKVLARNSRMIAERMLNDERGTWDSRHVEIVQGAIQQLARSSESDAETVALSLQNRMSDSIWMGNLELAETRAEVEAESHALQNDLLAMLDARQNALSPVPLEVAETERVLAAEPRKTVETAVSHASVEAIRSQMLNDARELKISKEYVEKLANQTSADNSSALSRATESLREASNRLLQAEYAKLGAIYKNVIASMHEVMQPETATLLADGLESALNAQDSNPEEILSHLGKIRQILHPISEEHPELRSAMRDLDKIQWRTNVLKDIASETPKPHEETKQAAQLLDARMLFEQKRMQFERNPEYRQAAPDLLKALDFEIEPQTYTPRPLAANPNVEQNIRRIRQIAQSAASGDIGMYAPVAGAEFVKNTTPALKLADKKTPNASFIPTIQSALAHRSNRVIRDARQIAYQPSLRADMGFAAPRYKMEAAQQPLFKRVRFTNNNAEANALLPALYKVSGIKVKSDQKTDKPLRKSHFGLNLSAANFEVIKIIEKQFKSTVEGFASDTIGGANLDASQALRDNLNPKTRVGGMISDWLDKIHHRDDAAADTTELIKTGRMDSGNIESKIKSEGTNLPTVVQQKLSPFLGFDISKVKIHVGPVASMAAEAMGAHAFTLGQHIFLGQNKLNYDTPEGLALLAHELLHTSHFSSSASVDAKEQAAESLEARVKKAFGTTTEKFLALEKNFDKVTAAPNLAKDQFESLKPESVGARASYDPDDIYDEVCERVLELFFHTLKIEKERNGLE